MSNNIYQLHHIIPKHIYPKIYGSKKGMHDPSNLILLPINEHAAWHYELWVYYGYWEDWLAWKNLLGQGKDPEVWFIKSRLGGLKSAANKKPKTTEQIEKQRISVSREYEVINPEGNILLIRNLSKFCKDNNLSYSTMINVAKGREGQHKGWTCRKIGDNIVAKTDKKKKKWIIIGPNGTKYITHGINQFCKKNNLHQRAMSQVAHGKQTNHKGWICQILDCP